MKRRWLFAAPHAASSRALRHNLRRRRAARHSAGGFTLVEVMVALVVTSLLVAVLMGALFYMYRVQESLQDELITREKVLRTRAWFEDVLSACLPIKADSGLANVPFSGSTSEIRCETTQSLRPMLGNAPVPVHLSLVRGDRRTRLASRRRYALYAGGMGSG